MTFIEILILAIGLSMDAFAVAICKGLSMKNGIKFGQMITVAGFFGGFQAIMPLIGYFLGSQFAKYIEKFDHWIAFGLLLFLGAKMLYECFTEKEDESQNDDFKIKELFVLAIATSIDALAVGISFAMIESEGFNIWFSVLTIGIITFILSCAGVFIGSKFGSKFSKPAQITGGIILILLGVKILLEHLGVINF